MALEKGRVGPDDKAKIIEEYKGGMKVAEIAKKFNRSENVINKIVDPSSAPATPATKAKKTSALFVPHFDPLFEMFKANREAVVVALLKDVEKEMGFKTKNAAQNGELILEKAAEYKALLKKAEELKGKITELAHKA